MNDTKKHFSHWLIIGCLLLGSNLSGINAWASGTSSRGNSEATVSFYYEANKPDLPLKLKPDKPVPQPSILPQTGEKKTSATLIGLSSVGVSLTFFIMTRKSRHDYK